MLNKIVKFSLDNRALVIVLIVLISLFGAYVTTQMDVDVFPDLTAPTVVVLTEAHGMAPEEVEQLVTFQIETAVNGATHVRRVRSSSSAGISIVWVEFEWDTDIYKARQIVNERISALRDRLPEGVGEPTMGPQSSIMGEVMLLSVTADSTSQMNLRTIADWTIRPRLLATGGVAQVIVIGGDFKQYQIIASPRRMRFFNVSLDELLLACEESNGNGSGGFMNEYGNEYIIKSVGRTTDVSEIGRSLIKMVDDRAIRIEDVADVQIGSADKIGDGSMNAAPAVIITVMKQPSTNTIELTKKIDLEIAEIQKSLPPDVKIDTQVFRQADFIQASVSNVQKTLIEGSLFVIIVLFLFLMNWKATVISLLAIPISLIASILALNWLGFTINTMSLGGMAIAIGSLVDDAIIDVENVYKRLKENASLPRSDRTDMISVVYDASVEIRSSIINATFIIIVAFIPLFFLSGMEGKLLAPLGISFIVSLLASLVVAMTLTPVLCSFLLARERSLEKIEGESWLVRNLQAFYRNTLQVVIRSKRIVLGVSVALLLVTIFLMSQLGRSFLPEFNEGSLVISVVTLPGISLTESNEIGQDVEEALRSIPEIELTTRRTGRAELDEHAQGVNAAEIDAPFTLEDRSREELLADVRDKLSGVSGAMFTIGQPISHRIDHMLSGTRAQIAIKIFGTDLNQMFSLANRVSKEIQGISGLVDISVEQQVEIPQIQIKAKRNMLNHYGISVAELNEFVDIAFAGEKVADVYENTRTFDLVLRFDEEHRGSLEAVNNALIDTHDGEKIPLSMVAEVISTAGPNTINRENVQRKIVVSANVAGRDQRSVVEEIQERISANIQLPEDYRIEYGGQFQAEQEASRTLLFASMLSFLVIFLLLFQEFKNMKIASIILLNLPLALIGGVFTVWLTSGVMSIPSIIGFITLFGIATRNGILLVSRYNALVLEGKSVMQSVVDGSVDRLSPILMTALTAGFALIPLAISGDLPGNEIQSPMAIVILGGLLSSTLLNIYVIPLVYIAVVKE